MSTLSVVDSRAKTSARQATRVKALEERKAASGATCETELATYDPTLGDLSEIGYDAEWDCLPAAAFGAPHIRDRVYLVAYPRGERHRGPDDTVFAGWSSSQLHGGWLPEPDVCRVVDGLSVGVDRVARLRSLGNAVVPQVAEWIGRRIMEAA